MAEVKRHAGVKQMLRKLVRTKQEGVVQHWELTQGGYCTLFDYVAAMSNDPDEFFSGIETLHAFYTVLKKYGEEQRSQITEKSCTFLRAAVHTLLKKLRGLDRENLVLHQPRDVAEAFRRFIDTPAFSMPLPRGSSEPGTTLMAIRLMQTQNRRQLDESRNKGCRRR